MDGWERRKEKGYVDIIGEFWIKVDQIWLVAFR